MTLRNVEGDLSLTALVVGTSKISLKSLSTSYTNSFQDTFNDEIVSIASFIPTCFSSKIISKVFIWVSNLNWVSRSLLKSEDIANVNDQNLLHGTFLKAYFLCLKSIKVIFLLRQKFGGSASQLLVFGLTP